MVTENGEGKKTKRIRTVLTMLQSGMICVLIMLVIFMMAEINRLQGTARVINYAGLVRGATQRLVKLEITENQDDTLIQHLDGILEDLQHENGSYGLTVLADENYCQILEELTIYWHHMKEQVQILRENAYEADDAQKLLDMSEYYFELADKAVSAAEEYSERIAMQIRGIEIASAFVMGALFLLIVAQTILALQMHKKNQLLAQKAYIDTHTGLQNKNRCEELLGNKELIVEPTACIMFDINNLKRTNDTLGHSAGDRLIADFARALRSVIREGDFAGRCGGDEFLVVLYRIDENAVEKVLARLHREVEQFNRMGRSIPISYACGWAISTECKNCTFRSLFDEADQCMYRNKRKMKSSLAEGALCTTLQS